MSSGGAGKLVGQTLGGYRLTALLGTGGMAEVYRGVDIRLGRAVAVKVLSQKLASDEEYVQRFRDEARRVAALQHPNVVQVYHYDEQEGQLFLVMPLIARSLRQQLEGGGRIPTDQSVRIVSEIAAGLGAAHAQGIIHRDVKPENILIDAEGHALLSDFGIARDDVSLSGPRTSQTLSPSGLPIGTIAYMAPEQLRQAPIDARVDIYALGAVLYELLTNRVPHEAGTIYEIAALTLSAPVVPPSFYNAEISPELETAVLTALAYEPTDRFASAGAFAEALHAAMEQVGQHAWRPSMPIALLPGDSASGRTNILSGETMPTTPTPFGQTLGIPSRPLVAVAPLLSRSLSVNTANAVPNGAPGVHPEVQRVHGRTRGRAALLAVLLLALTFSALGVILLFGNLSIGRAGPQKRAGSTDLPILTGTAGSFGSPGGTVIPSSPGAILTVTPQGTLVATATATILSTPTDTPTGGPTGTPSPPNVFASNFSAGGKHRCAGSQTITNQGTIDISWTWTPPITPPLPGDFQWQLNGGQMKSGLPTSSDLAAGASDTVTIGINCDKNDHPFTITFSASDVGYPSQATRTTFTMDVHGN